MPTHQQFDNAEWASMDVSIELTDAGVAHVEEVVRAVYAYLHVIRCVVLCFWMDGWVGEG